MKLQIAEKFLSIDPHHFDSSVESVKKKTGVKNVFTMAANESAWGASPMVVRALRSALQKQHRYPDGEALEVKNILAQKNNLDPGEFVVGTGSSEILELLVRAFVEPGVEVVTSHPSFYMYSRYVKTQGGENFVVPLKNQCHDLESIRYCISDKTRLVILDNPNNPTGSTINPGELYRFLSEVPESVVVVIDEAYVDFMEDELQVDVFSLVRNTEKRCAVVFVRTFSKLYGLAGLRIGYGIMPKEISQILQKIRQPYNVSQMAIEAAVAAVKDNGYYDKVRELVIEGRSFLNMKIEEIGYECCISEANFLFIDIRGDADKLCKKLQGKGVIVRSLKSYGFPQAIRVTVGKKEENNTFIKALSQSLQELQYV